MTLEPRSHFQSDLGTWDEICRGISTPNGAEKHVVGFQKHLGKLGT